MPAVYEFAEMKLTRRVGMIWWGAFLIAAGTTGSFGIFIGVMVNGPPTEVLGETWAPVVFGYICMAAMLTIGIALIALSRYGPDKPWLSREPLRPPLPPK